MPDWESDPHAMTFPGGETLAELHHRVGHGRARRRDRPPRADGRRVLPRRRGQRHPADGAAHADRPAGSSCSRRTPRSPSCCSCARVGGGWSATTTPPTSPACRSRRPGRDRRSHQIRTVRPGAEGTAARPTGCGTRAASRTGSAPCGWGAVGDATVTRWVVVGAGAAGCVVAARLAEVPGHHVTLVEAGPGVAGEPGGSGSAVPGAVRPGPRRRRVRGGQRDARHGGRPRSVRAVGLVRRRRRAGPCPRPAGDPRRRRAGSARPGPAGRRPRRHEGPPDPAPRPAGDRLRRLRRRAPTATSSSSPTGRRHGRARGPAGGRRAARRRAADSTPTASSWPPAPSARRSCSRRPVSTPRGSARACATTPASRSPSTCATARRRSRACSSARCCAAATSRSCRSTTTADTLLVVLMAPTGLGAVRATPDGVAVDHVLDDHDHARLDVGRAMALALLDHPAFRAVVDDVVGRDGAGDGVPPDVHVRDGHRGRRRRRASSATTRCTWPTRRSSRTSPGPTRTCPR